MASSVSFKVVSFEAQALVVETRIPLSDKAFTTTSPLAPTKERLII